MEPYIKISMKSYRTGVKENGTGPRRDFIELFSKYPATKIEIECITET